MNGLLTIFDTYTNKSDDYNTLWATKFSWSGFNDSINYPYKLFLIKDHDVYIEGCIYNYSEDAIISVLTDIINSEQGPSKEKEIKKFIDSADGEFIIQIFDRKSSCCFIIFDKYARIPLYYYDNSKIILARNINEILRLSQENKLNRDAVQEYLTFEFFLGNKTFFQDIYRVEPGEYIQIQNSNHKPVLEVIKFEYISYDPKKWKNKKFFLNEYYIRFVEAVQNRINTLYNSVDSIVESTLSGGFDTRAVFGELNKTKVKTNYYTYEYTQDESLIARELMSSVGDNNSYKKLIFDNSYNEHESRDFIFECQGLATSLTSYVCSKDNQYVAEITSNKPLWGGFGGEYIRHPFKRRYRNLYDTINCGLLTYDLCEFNNILKDTSSSDFKERLNNYFNLYSEKTLSGKLKHFYNEYYLHRVGNGEDLWGRRYYWTIHPMMARPLIDLFLEMPLQFASYSTYKEFLKKINPVLLSVDIYNDYFRLSSKCYIIKDFIITLKNIILIIIQGYCPCIWNFLKKMLASTVINKETNNVTVKDIKVFLYHFSLDFFKNPFRYFIQSKSKKLDKCKQATIENNSLKIIPFYDEILGSSLINTYFNIDIVFNYMKRQNTLNDNRLYSLLLYLLEIEKRGYPFV